MWLITRLFFLAVALKSSSLVSAQVCGEPGREAGLPGLPGTPAETSDGTRIMAQSGGINCHGVVKEWRFYRTGGTCAQVDFQIWRDAGGGSYTLVGFNTFIPANHIKCTDPAPGDIIFRIPALEQIPVYPGDVLGWTQADAELMLQQVPGEVLSENCGGVNPGDGCPITGGTDNNAYSVRAYVVTGTAPAFGNMPNYVDIPENEAVGTDIFTATATHQSAASPLDNIWEEAVPLVFSIDPPMTEFTIASTTNGEGVVTTAVTYDYETQQQYLVTVAVEGLDLTSTAMLTVNIEDVNEAHVIDNLPANIAISALTTTENDQIYQVTVSDPSDGSPLTVLYSIQDTACTNGGAAITVSSPFGIESNTGVVFVTQDLADWTEADQCVVTIGTTDMYNFVADDLTIDITDIKQPVAILNLPQQIDIPETVAGGSAIYKVLTDSTEPSTLRYQLSGSTPENYNFEIDAQTGVVSVVPLPDFDTAVHTQYVMEVTVTDKFGRQDVQDLTIDITWVNQAPYYHPTVYNLSMPENCDLDPDCPIAVPPDPAWDTTLLLYVHDRDVENQLPTPGADSLVCDLVPSFGSDKFSIASCDAGSGPPPNGGNTLLQVGAIDLDATPEYQFMTLTATVTDQAGLADTAVIHIEVYDINDNAPVFNPTTYAASIEENTPGGVSVLTVTATDADWGINGEFTYSIDDTSTPPEPKGSKYFQVDAVSGVVSTKHPVDYEAYAQPVVVRFDVLATDKGVDPGPQTGRASVSITIDDQNDNRPVYDCTNKPADEPYEPQPECFYNLDLKDNTIEGYMVLQLVATDVDTVPGTPVTFYLLKPEDHFRLDADGSIVVDHQLRESHKYILYCMAQDNAGGDPNLLASPPAVVRIDSFPREKHLIDITLGIDNFNVTQDGFIRELRILLYPWFVKTESYTIHDDKTTVTIYALKDNSTYLYGNLDKGKGFVHRDDLLDKTRKNIHGDPHDDLLDENFEDYDVILVMPTYPNWWLDTVPGLVTLSLLCLVAFLLLFVTPLVLLCRKYKWLCFKEKPPPTNHDWPDPDAKSNSQMEMDDTSSLRYRTSSRRGSVDTVHSLVYDPRRTSIQ